MEQEHPLLQDVEQSREVLSPEPVLDIERVSSGSDSLSGRGTKSSAGSMLCAPPLWKGNGGGGRKVGGDSCCWRQFNVEQFAAFRSIRRVTNRGFCCRGRKLREFRMVHASSISQSVCFIISFNGYVGRHFDPLDRAPGPV